MIHLSMNKVTKVLFYPLIRFCEYLGVHHPVLLVKLRYWARFKKLPDLKNPKDLNEKILWSKLYSDTSEWVRLGDKYRVREYVESLGLGDILTRLYAAWFSIEEVNFDILPQKFILKSNNGDGKGQNKIVDKMALGGGTEDLLKLISSWLNKKNVGALGAEPHYRKMKPCVIAEELLTNDKVSAKYSNSIIDYKFWCFGGVPEYIFCVTNRTNETFDIMVYDKDWNAHPEHCVFSSSHRSAEIIPKPKNFERMKEIVAKLSKGFPYLRVDLYNLDGKIYFGELTFSSLGGMMNYFTPQFLLEMGGKVDLES